MTVAVNIMHHLQILKHAYSMLGIIYLAFVLQSCATHPHKSVYEQVGGQAGIEKLSDAFIDEIQYDKRILTYFLDANIDRFREKFIEHICVHLDGPCTYSGDDMLSVHKGMNITEADFNRVVELMINAMTRTGISHHIQNQVLAKLAPMRGEMIYH